MGLPGALVAVPAAAIAQILLHELLALREDRAQVLVPVLVPPAAGP
jgi:predicted PurR-regulated permease PerM